MVLIGGPRQVGKTTYATSLIDNFKDNHPAYLNWDNELEGGQTFIKGIWDKWKNTQRFVVTGSARLDILRKTGDSMLGR